MRSSPADISICIVHYRSDRFRPRLLESLGKFTDGYELLEHWNDDENLGFSKAANLLIRKSRGRFIVLLNPDSEVTRDWAKTLIQKADEDKLIGIVTPKLLQFTGIIDSTGHDYSKWPYQIADRGQGETDTGRYDRMTELRSCNFGCVLIKRSLIRQIGLLDERFFLYYEDVEYCHRANKVGWKVKYCPDSTVYHQRHGSGHNMWMDESRRYLPYILRKYYPPRELAKWYVNKAEATLAGLKNKDMPYAFSNFRAMVNGVW